VEQIEQKKRKKKKQNTMFVTEEVSESGQQLIEYMDKLESEKTYLTYKFAQNVKAQKLNVQVLWTATYGVTWV